MRAMVKSILMTMMLGAMSFRASAQETLTADDLLQSAQTWMQDNLDDSVWDALGLDENRVKQFLTEVQKRLQGENLYDLGGLEETGQQLIPVLQQFEETRPYGVWLQTHLDYFTTATQLRVSHTAKTNAAQPTVQLQRKVWVQEVKNRPLPVMAQKYVPRLKPVFSEEKVPPEMVWLGEVESSFNPGARSPAGAAGMFQMMPGTAKRFNLSSRPTDERFDPDKNARAAARYLRLLHNRFGDWRLALAAYNCGEQRVENLLKGSKIRSYDAIAARLPAETQMYVPKFEAVLLKREGKAITDLAKL